MTQDTQTFVLDSFALLAFFQDEPGAEIVTNLLKQAQRGEVSLLMTVLNVGEVFYRTIRDYGSERAHEVLGRLDEYAIEVMEIDRNLALEAAHLKGKYQMGYVDCYVAALAKARDATLVTGDPDFKELGSLVQIRWLPKGEVE